MRKKGNDDLDNDFESDDELYASFDAYKTLLDSGVSKTDALKKTGLTPQIVKDLEAEEAEENDEIKDEFKDVWYSSEEDEDGGEGEWKEEDDDFSDDDWDDSDDVADGGDWDDKF